MSDQQQNNDGFEENEKDTIVEELEIAGSELVDRVKQLIEDGNVRRLIIRKADNEVLMVVPLTASVVAGGAMLVFAPVLAALGAAAAFLAKVKLEIVRVDDSKTKNSDKTKIDLD
ncbi:MAG: hypothetical protein Phog2KO_42230 [Phototrophicaceae bacterium]